MDHRIKDDGLGPQEKIREDQCTNFRHDMVRKRLAKDGEDKAVSGRTCRFS